MSNNNDLIKRNNKLNIYGLFGVFKLAVYIVRTKFIIPNARLIRFPFEIRGKKYIKFGHGLTTGTGCRIEVYPVDNKSTVLEIGENVQMNDNVHITAVNHVSIGNNVLMASKIYISDSSHGSYSGDEFDSDPDSIPENRPLKYKSVVIEDNVWIGEFVSILPGTKIGRGSIIGTMSVVTKDIPPYCIAAGIPAKPIKKYNFDTRRWEKYNN
jgi:lipopolysaccharide O-acetyltransferase